MSLPIDSPLDFQNVNKGVNHPDPTNAQDIATKHYVDSIAQGVIYKQAVVAVSTANVSVTAPGAIGSATAGQRVLLTGQTDATQDGIWVWNGAASALTRPNDFAHGAVEEPGTSVFNEANNSTWVMNTSGNVTVDTTAQSWVQAAGAATLSFTAPLTQNGSTVSLNNGNPLPLGNGGTGSATAPGARANLGATGKYATTVGDGATTSFAVTHNLGTTDVEVNVYDMATGNLELVQTVINSNNQVTVGPFGTAPAAAGGTIGSGTGKRVVVIG